MTRRTFEALLPDGRTITRTSTSRGYTHVVVVGTPVAVRRARLLAEITSEQERLDRYAAVLAEYGPTVFTTTCHQGPLFRPVRIEASHSTREAAEAWQPAGCEHTTADGDARRPFGHLCVEHDYAAYVEHATERVATLTARLEAISNADGIEWGEATWVGRPDLVDARVRAFTRKPFYAGCTVEWFEVREITGQPKPRTSATRKPAKRKSTTGTMTDAERAAKRSAAAVKANATRKARAATAAANA